MINLPNILPWNTQALQQLTLRKKQNCLPHALLLTGAEGLGKKQFALALAQNLLCNKLDVFCGQCHACYMFQAQSHPDLMVVEPEQAGQMIKIDQIREIVQFINETALQGVMRIIIINPANAMNIYAANALLKTLEEPAPNTLIILLSPQSLRLPATIISRCQKIHFQKPEQEISLRWLESQLQEKTVNLQLVLNFANGAPLKAKKLIEEGVFLIRQELYQGLDLLAQSKKDPLELAVQCQEQDMQMLLNLLYVWLQDFMRFQLTKGEAKLINVDYQPVFARLALNFSCEKLLNYFDFIKKIYAHVHASLNLNRQLLLEELFIRWTQHATC